MLFSSNGIAPDAPKRLPLRVGSTRHDARDSDVEPPSQLVEVEQPPAALLRSVPHRTAMGLASPATATRHGPLAAIGLAQDAGRPPASPRNPGNARQRPSRVAVTGLLLATVDAVSVMFIGSDLANVSHFALESHSATRADAPGACAVYRSDAPRRTLPRYQPLCKAFVATFRVSQNVWRHHNRVVCLNAIGRWCCVRLRCDQTLTR